MGTLMDSPCGPGAPCRAQLEAMEMAHQRALRELRERHEREIRELEEQKDRLMQEEIQSAAKGKVPVVAKEPRFTGTKPLVASFPFVLKL